MGQRLERNYHARAEVEIRLRTRHSACTGNSLVMLQRRAPEAGVQIIDDRCHRSDL